MSYYDDTMIVTHKGGHMKRKVILNLAVSLDGYIATDEGGYEWIKGDGSHELDTERAFDFEGFLETVDTMIMGRKSYDDCPLDPFSDKEILIVSRRDYQDFENVKFINDDIIAYVKDMLNKEGKNIYLFGGGELIDHFIKAEIIDEYVIAIIPVILGKGRKLFLENNPMIPLKLYDYNVGEGVVALHYRLRD